MFETQEMQVRSLDWEDLPEEENGNPLQHSCLENPVDRGGWQATVHRVAKSWKWLKEQHAPGLKSFDFTTQKTIIWFQK